MGIDTHQLAVDIGIAVTRTGVAVFDVAQDGTGIAADLVARRRN
jgi:hypothetical protein